MSRQRQRGKGAWIWGRRVVTETLEAGRWPILELLLADRRDDRLSSAHKLAEELGVPVSVVADELLEERCSSDLHHGFAARVGDYPYAEAETVLAKARASPLYVLLDGIQDPYNFGAIVRSAEVLGVDGVFISGARQAPVTGHVARASAGAVNHVNIVRVDNLVEMVMGLRRSGVRVLAADRESFEPPWACRLAGAVALVVGNEGHGVGADVIDVCDGQVGIPQRGSVESLNAAVAVGILLYEADRQRREVADDG